MVVSVINSSFLVYILWIVLKEYPVYTCEKNSCQLTEAFHVLYNVQLDDKCENERKDLCWNTDNLSLGQED